MAVEGHTLRLLPRRRHHWSRVTAANKAEYVCYIVLVTGDEIIYYGGVDMF